MKTKLKVLSFTAISALLTSCGSSKVATYLEAFTPEESGLNLVKLTDESTNSIISGNATKEPVLANRAYYKNSSWAYSAEANFKWCPLRTLAISPDGSKLAYLYKANGQSNIMVRSSGANGAATQRTFRDVLAFSWAKDNKLYFSDRNGVNYYISAINAEQGSMMQQITNGSVVDWNPASIDGQKVYFSRQSTNGPAVWSLDRKDGTLTSCASGYNVCLIPNDPEAFYCVRNSSSGRSEIWYVNYIKGQETLILTDGKRSFANPCLSPDGKWLAVEGNSTSAINNVVNTDIFVVRTDGTRLTQLTYNPSLDMCPVWAKDGRSIYFLSTRANRDKKYNIWRMNFNIE